MSVEAPPGGLILLTIAATWVASVTGSAHWWTPRIASTHRMSRARWSSGWMCVV